MSWDVFVAVYHQAIKCRKVLTWHEVRAAWQEGVLPSVLAMTNDGLAKEYDE